MASKNQFYILFALYSQNQWGEARSLTLFKAKDKLEC